MQCSVNALGPPIIRKLTRQVFRQLLRVIDMDAVLVTHSDNDHYSVPTCRDLAQVTGVYQSTQYVASLMQQDGFPAHGHDIGEHFAIGPVRVEVTPADHAWQNASPGAIDRIFEPEDCCRFWIDTPGGTIWAPGCTNSGQRRNSLTEPLA